MIRGCYLLLISPLLAVGFVGVLTSCGSNAGSHHGNFGQPPTLTNLQPETPSAGKAFLTQFAHAHALADSIVMLAIKDTSVHTSLTTKYGFLYPSWVKHLDDTLTGPALEYQFYYGLLYENDTIGSANVRIGADMRVNSCEIYELIAYRKFLDKELQIGPTDALTRATAYGVKKKDVSITFHSTGYFLDTLSNFRQARMLYENAVVDPGGFYWEIMNDCNGCAYLKVDATKGKVFGQGQVTFMY